MFEIQFDPDPARALFGLTWKKSRALFLNEAYVVRAFHYTPFKTFDPFKMEAARSSDLFFHRGQRRYVFHKAKKN